MKPRSLSDDEARELYREYCEWLRAKFLWHPRRLAKRHGICIETLRRYVREQKDRAA